VVIDITTDPEMLQTLILMLAKLKAEAYAKRKKEEAEAKAALIAAAAGTPLKTISPTIQTSSGALTLTLTL
jgi:hypothetical protein